MKRHTIYGLRLKGGKEVRYIGMTNGSLDVRLNGHVAAARRLGKPYGLNGELCAWVAEHGEKVEAFKIAYVENREEAFAYEKAIIALCLRLEHRLFNQRGLPLRQDIAA